MQEGMERINTCRGRQEKNKYPIRKEKNAIYRGRKGQNQKETRKKNESKIITELSQYRKKRN